GAASATAHAEATSGPRILLGPGRIYTHHRPQFAVYQPLVTLASEPERLGDDVLLDLGGSSVDRRHHRGAEVPLHRVLRRVSVAAHDLHPLERTALGELGGGELH